MTQANEDQGAGELLPCPRGHDAVRTSRTYTNFGEKWYGGCCDCNWTGPLEPTQAEAITAWNTRHEAQSELVEAFQNRVGGWMGQCFTPEIIADKLERSDRFIEESLELVQACGYSADRAQALVDYVFGRPVGEPTQEVGGVMVTLAALCNPHKMDMAECGETELARILAPEVIEKIRAKQASKPVGSALPIPTKIGAKP